MADINFARIAIQIEGNNGVADRVFRYANDGIVTTLGADSTPFYYYPNINDSILLKSTADIDAIIDGTNSDAFSIKLSNIDGSLDELFYYNFDGRNITVYLSTEISPNPIKFYTLYSGEIENLSVNHKVVEIKALSRFDIFDIPVNPNNFTGVEVDFEGTEGITDKPKPRLFGKVFNITPTLLKSNTWLYGISWDINGDRDALIDISSVRDNGAELVLDVGAANSIAGNYTTTALMDLETPADGGYITCLAEGTFKLVAKPDNILTIDAEQAENTYTAWIQKITSELPLEGYHMYEIPSYTLGHYCTSTETYTQVDNALANGLSIFKWFGFDEHLNASSYSDISAVTPIANFVYAGIDLSDDSDIPVFSVTRDRYVKPYANVNMQYRKNYTIQDQGSLAGVVLEADNVPFKEESSYINTTQSLSPSYYTKDLEYSNYTAIYEDVDAISHIDNWVLLRDKTIDIKSVVCPILSFNSTIILGIVQSGISAFVNISSTDQPVIPATTDIVGISASRSTFEYGISHDNTDYSGQRNLRLGDVVTLTTNRFNEASLKHIIVEILINTRKMQVTYGLISKRDY